MSADPYDDLEFLAEIVRDIATRPCEYHGSCGETFSDPSLFCWPCRIRRELKKAGVA